MTDLFIYRRAFNAQVKPLGVYAMIDDGELDWKIIAISTSDPLADKLNDVEDVERCAHAIVQSQGPLSQAAARVIRVHWVDVPAIGDRRRQIGSDPPVAPSCMPRQPLLRWLLY